MHFFFFLSIDNYEIAQKHANFKLGVQYPCKLLCKILSLDFIGKQFDYSLNKSHSLNKNDRIN